MGGPVDTMMPWSWTPMSCIGKTGNLFFPVMLRKARKAVIIGEKRTIAKQDPLTTGTVRSDANFISKTSLLGQCYPSLTEVFLTILAGAAVFADVAWVTANVISCCPQATPSIQRRI